MNIRILCEMIDMPEEVIQEIETWKVEEYRDVLERYWALIQDKTKWNTAMEEVKEILVDDKNGLKCLAFLLQIGIRTYQEYLLKGIPEQIYFDTMCCFSRFVNEHKESYGSYGFDRDWWTARELSLKEFRLGELEYEMVWEEGNNLVSVHIPSDAKLEKQSCRESYRKARSFFAKYAIDYAAVEFYCKSWLLSPKLKELLAEDSKIIGFQNDFILDSFEPEDTGYMLWVFKKEDLSLEEVPQKTSLQRKMKAYLQNGGKIGEGKGHLKIELFE